MYVSTQHFSGIVYTKSCAVYNVYTYTHTSKTLCIGMGWYRQRVLLRVCKISAGDYWRIRTLYLGVYVSGVVRLVTQSKLAILFVRKFEWS